jgi:uncharacterized BrkB/YihY/UPF0761 family membrane protein
MMTSTACDDDDGSERVRDSDDTERFLCESDEISKVLLLNNLENGMYAQYAVHALQSGSFMYGLSTKSSDQDFDVVKKKKKRKIDRKRLFQLLLLLLLLLLLFLFFTPVFIDVLLSILILSLSFLLRLLSLLSDSLTLFTPFKIYLSPAMAIYTTLQPPPRLFESHSISSSFASDKV